VSRRIQKLCRDEYEGKSLLRHSILFVRHLALTALLARLIENLHVELPPLDVLARILARDDHNELRDFSMHHPFIELGHYFLDVGFYLVV